MASSSGLSSSGPLPEKAEKRFYVGEAAGLIKRLSQPHSSIPNWDFFRYGTRSIPGAVLKNKKDVLWHAISDCELANDRVDI